MLICADCEHSNYNCEKCRYNYKNVFIGYQKVITIMARKCFNEGGKCSGFKQKKK